MIYYLSSPFSQTSNIYTDLNRYNFTSNDLLSFFIPLQGEESWSGSFERDPFPRISGRIDFHPFVKYPSPEIREIDA